MSEQAVFTVTIEADLHDQFLAAAEASDRPAGEVVQEFMRDFIDRRDDQYRAFLQRKVDLARQSIEAGDFVPHEVIKADIARRRAEFQTRR